MAAHRGEYECIEDLSLEQHHSYQEMSWRAERIGWLTLGLIIIAAALGFLAPGPLGERKVTSHDGVLEARYFRFLHRDAPEGVQVRVRVDGQDSLTLFLSSDYLSTAQVDSVTPTPEEIFFTEGFLGFRFLNEAKQGTLEVTLYLSPNEAGRWTGELKGPGGQTVPLSHFVYP